MPRVLPRAYYTAPVADFLTSSSETILGTLTTNSDFAVDQSQRDAWLQEIAILRKSLAGLAGTLFFEFTIPRMGHRVDVLLVTAAVVVVIEFKIGAKEFFRAEARRAWNHEQTASFMRNKKKLPNFLHSEPEFLISCLDRHQDWAAVVCLVGGGQEINKGEAGIAAWLDALNTTFQDWDVYISPELTDSEYAAGHALDYLRTRSHVTPDRDLHLAVSMRSFRAENVSHFVKAVLDCDKPAARCSYAELASRYPIALTRNLDHAKGWIRKHARGSERYGLVASSKAQRLKPHAIDVRVEVDPAHWFLDGRNDTRSSYYLEDAATEFQIQGLELDWVCVTWDGDLRFGEAEWNYHRFRGAAWCNIGKPERRTYLRNAYRVLLTRARQGMVIFIPQGDPDDPTRKPEFYDPTFNYLAGLGIPVLAS